MKGKIKEGRILVKVREQKEKTENGIIIPSMVVAQKVADVFIGYGEVAKDDVIYFTQGQGQKVVIDGESYLLLRETDVLYIE